MRRASLIAALLVAGTAGAVEVPLPPGATLAAEDAVTFAVTSLPEGPWAGGPPPAVGAEGAVTRRAWRVAEGGLTPDQLLAPIRDALVADGFTVLYTCADRACGGYDFRFGLDLLPAPAMFVDLGNYRYLVAEADTEDGRRLAAVVTSTGLGAGYVHVTTVDPAAQPVALPDLQGPPAPDAAAPAPVEPAPAPADLAQRLVADGHVVLDGLDFPSGSASLAADRYESLVLLAAFLAANPTATIVLVGHTDATGTLAANTALSRARAQAVRTRLIGAHGSDGDRITAEGAGFLAPVASNLTPEGQAANRRVEAVLLSAP
jgi:outer membrane protein OmpA-like peptidoglycan-associated protein